MPIDPVELLQNVVNQFGMAKARNYADHVIKALKGTARKDLWLEALAVMEAGTTLKATNNGLTDQEMAQIVRDPISLKNRIDVIKQIRERTGCGLREANSMVDAASAEFQQPIK